MRNKVLLIILDGLGDLPNSAMSGRTPLEEAATPFMDRLAREGATGTIDPYRRGLFPTSEDTHFSLFGYRVEEYQIGRGVFEALGLGVDLKEQDLAWRGNWATLDNSGSLVDRRAGRISASEELLADIKELTVDGIKFEIHPGTDHRMAIVARGSGLSRNLSDGYRRQVGVPPPLVTPLDKTEESVATARTVNRYLEKVQALLKDNPANRKRMADNLPPANYILIRGAGQLKKVPAFSEKWGRSAACVAGGHLYRGVAKLLGMQIVNVPGANAGVKTNLAGKLKTSLGLLEDNDFVFCHIKATDNLSHDRNCWGKAEFLSRIDHYLNDIFDLQNCLVVITGDHSTPCESGEHSNDPIPMLAWGAGVVKDQVSRFGEIFCREGGLGKLEQVRLMEKIAKMADGSTK